MLECLANVSIGSLMIFGFAYGIFRIANRRVWKTRIEIDPKMGEERPIKYSEFGTRVSRWRGYSCIAGAVLGYQLYSLPFLFEAARTGVFNSMIHMENIATAAFGEFLIGLIAGYFSSFALSDEPLPKKED